MGNRAVIVFQGQRYRLSSLCVQLQWNGGRASIEGFLQAARQLNIRRPRREDTHDHDRAIRQLGHLIGTYFFGYGVGFTTYVLPYADAHRNNRDNGVYVINADFEIVERLHAGHNLEEWNAEKTEAICQHITQRAPIFND